MTSNKKICTKCNHQHTKHNECMTHINIYNPKCNCNEQNIKKSLTINALVNEYPFVSVLQMYPNYSNQYNTFCEKCKKICECSICKCTKCLTKNNSKTSNNVLKK